MKTWLSAAGDVTPFLERWLGPQPRTQLTLLDLPDPEDAPWESRHPARHQPSRCPARPAQVRPAHCLDPRLDESLDFMAQRRHRELPRNALDRKTKGRDKALATLEAGRNALALAEPASPADGAGQPLTRAIAPVYYRTKATYVLWMLRDLVGDDALSAALHRIELRPDLRDCYYHVRFPESASFQQALKKAAPRRDLSWFFSDWVDADKGLPDLTTKGVPQRRAVG